MIVVNKMLIASEKWILQKPNLKSQIDPIRKICYIDMRIRQSLKTKNGASNSAKKKKT